MRWSCPCSCSPCACIAPRSNEQAGGLLVRRYRNVSAFEGAARAAITDLKRGRAITTWLVTITLETTRANVGISSLLRWKAETRQVITTTTIALHVDHASPARHAEKRGHVA